MNIEGSEAHKRILRRLAAQKMTRGERLSAAYKMIGYQFPDSPNHKLMNAIVNQAIRDAFGPDCADCDKAGALQFLRTEMLPAEISGVDSEWIRIILDALGFDIDAEEEIMYSHRLHG